MESIVPPHLVEEQQAVEAEIREAFRGVTREGGISWSECNAIDEFAPGEVCAAARTSDTESSWEELVDDPDWDGIGWPGQFCFLDAIGFRYYIAPAMIIFARCGEGDEFIFHISGKSEYREQISLLNEAQCRAIARFVRFMMNVQDALAAEDTSGGSEYELERESWENSYRSYWHQWPEPVSEH